jgi:hypothetical protein
MWRHVALVSADVSDEPIASIITVENNRELVTMLAVSMLVTATLLLARGFFSNLGSFKSHTASQPRRRYSSKLKYYNF